MCVLAFTYKNLIFYCMDRDTRETLVLASRPVRLAAAAALSVLALFLLVKTFDALSRFGHGDNPPLNTITVSGEGQSLATPDIARISFTVQETAASVALAQAAATTRTNDTLTAVKALGIDEKDVKTEGYSVYPQYQNSSCAPGVMCMQNGSPKISGYQVSQSVSIKVRDTAKAGDVLQKLGTLGVQNISGPEFSVDDPSLTAAEARGKAITDARSKAQVLAKQLGVKLGTVVNFSESGNSPYPMYSNVSKGAAMDSAAVAPSLPVGQDETKITVQITYEIR